MNDLAYCFKAAKSGNKNQMIGSQVIITNCAKLLYMVSQEFINVLNMLYIMKDLGHGFQTVDEKLKIVT